MKRILTLLCAVTTAASVIESISLPAEGAEDGGSPIFGVTIPARYREWELISVAHESGLDELRAILGNTIATKAYQDGTLPFPEGTILAKIAWKHVPLAEIDGAFVSGARRRFRSWSRTPRDTRRPAVGGSAGLSTANPSTKRSIKHASLATRPT